MSTSDLKQRKPATNGTLPNGAPHSHDLRRTISIEDSLGPPQHGIWMQLLRVVCFGIYFFASAVCIHGAQLVGAPLYFISKEWFYAYMALTKQYFGLLIVTMTHGWSPTVVRISGDKSMQGLLRQKSNGLLEVDFGERAVLMSNHQLYTDWLYLWWIAYTNATPVHGHVYIILKDSLKYVPIIGPAMQFYSFIFMARKWAKDQKRLRYRLQKLNTQSSTSTTNLSTTSSPRLSTEHHLDPMWLFIFPEGTNLSANTRTGSAKFAAKSHIPDLKHQLLPRSTGLQFCLQELKDTVPYLYDCTIAYEGIPDGGYGQDIFTLRSVYFQGRPPKSVNMHWRRFSVKDMPLDDADAMHEWAMARWREKDEMIERFKRDGLFPAEREAVEIEPSYASPASRVEALYIDTEVKPRNSLEFLTMFGPVAAAVLVGRIGVQIFDRIFGTGPLFRT